MVLKNFLLFLWNMLKHIILFPLYCSFPDKYSGVSYEEWLGENKTKNEDDEGDGDL